eukprot:5277882-Prymnesium_polylepis.1
MGCACSSASSSSASSSSAHRSVTWPEPLREALKDTTLVDAAWLSALAKRGGIIPRCQDVPKKAKVTLNDMQEWSDYFTLPLLVISYPWLGRNHPDERGEQLQRIAFVFSAFARQAETDAKNSGRTFC